MTFLALSDPLAALPVADEKSLLPRRRWTGQKVETRSGGVVGHPAKNATEVSEYLAIPYAQLPVGNLRFAAPQRYAGNGTIDASSFDCPANVDAGSGSIVSELAGPNAAQLLIELSQAGDNFSDDCLTINVWTKRQSGEQKKAVLFWIYGGGFETGTTNRPTYNGQYLAGREDVVVVSANYRLNIFGFPGLTGLSDVPQNPGLLDQRMVVEWTRDNIANFGCDLDRITISVQSAGGASVDYYNYAWTEDPVIAGEHRPYYSTWSHRLTVGVGSIAESGTATSFSNPAPLNNTAAFLSVASNLSCPATDARAALDSLRSKSFQDLFQAEKVGNPLQAILGEFGSTADEQGKFMIAYCRHWYSNISDQAWDLFNLITFTCPAANAAQVRAEAGVPTWKYRYYGEIPNLRLTLNHPSGAWHGSDFAIVFQTALYASGEPITPAEDSISKCLSGAWAAFAKDPRHAFDLGPYAFLRYNIATRSLIKFGQNNATLPTFTYPNATDAQCQALQAAVAALELLVGLKQR